jgi:recombinational DNA repair ATPase RecF
MIRIKTIQIDEFRGIRDLDLELAGKNFGICGPNGTGKSGVVDAIEFCVTGDVTRLSGQGSAGLSVKAHGPHVDQRDHPEKATVTMTAAIPSLGKDVTIQRSVKNPSKLTFTPSDAKIKSVLEDLQTHPEFALSRREIVKYIITPPGRRSEDVQTLLRLDHLEKLRKSFTTFCNKRKSEADESEHVRAVAETDFKNGLKLATLEPALLLGAVNAKRDILGFPALVDLNKDTSFKAGLAALQPGQKAPVIKASALSDLSALQSVAAAGEPSQLAQHRNSARLALQKLKTDSRALTLARQHGFLKTGLDLVTGNACPLCDTAWDPEKLREHLRKKLLSAQELEQTLSALRTSLDAIRQALAERVQMVGRVEEHAQGLKPAPDVAALESYVTTLKDADNALKTFVSDHSDPEPALHAVTAEWWQIGTTQQACIAGCKATLDALPDTSAEDQAREYLIVAQDRYEKLLAAAKLAKDLDARKQVAEKVLAHYNDTCTKVLEGIYEKVADDFTKYYRVINRDDEQKFVGNLKAAPAKLNFDVDFYGRGLFPPGAYHSEGHQDGMGLCLYLALMKHTLGDNFTFAVLDDVLMSVDAGHRRDVCRLLKSEFAKTQFILTTHDRVWLQYMKTEGLIAHSQSFGGWTVDAGPRVWDDNDVWLEIQNKLDKEDVHSAAALLRRYLEYTATILADNLHAPVEFRGDGHYELGDLLPHVLTEWKNRLGDGEKSAQFWKREKEKAALATLRAKAKTLIAKTQTDQWAINLSVHFNNWENFQAHEFKEVVEAFKELFEHLRCQHPDCKSYLYVSPRKGPAEALRCNCGATTINLKT